MSPEIFFDLIPGKDLRRPGWNRKVAPFLASLDPDELPIDQANQGIYALLPEELPVGGHGGSRDTFFYALYDSFIGNAPEKLLILPESPWKVSQVRLDGPQTIPLGRVASLAERHVKVLRAYPVEVTLPPPFL